MSVEMFTLLLEATVATLYMVFLSGAVAFILGTPLGVLLMATKPQGLFPHPQAYRIMGFIVDMTRSVPFVILLIAIIPFTRLIVGTSIGTSAATVPLTVAAIPFVARIVENALNEIPKGLIEAGLAMGSTHWQLISHILIPEAAASITSGYTITLINLVGYTAMAGAVGGGGLGDLAIRYGYQRFDINTMIFTIIILVIMVQIIQGCGTILNRWLQHH